MRRPCAVLAPIPSRGEKPYPKRDIGIMAALTTDLQEWIITPCCAPCLRRRRRTPLPHTPRRCVIRCLGGSNFGARDASWLLRRGRSRAHPGHSTTDVAGSPRSPGCPLVRDGPLTLRTSSDAPNRVYSSFDGSHPHRRCPLTRAEATAASTSWSLAVRIGLRHAVRAAAPETQGECST